MLSSQDREGRASIATYQSSLSIGLFMKNQSIVGVVSILMLAFVAAPTASAAQWEFLKQKEALSSVRGIPSSVTFQSFVASVRSVPASLRSSQSCRMHQAQKTGCINASKTVRSKSKMFMTGSSITEPIRHGRFRTEMLSYRLGVESMSPASVFSLR